MEIQAAFLRNKTAVDLDIPLPAVTVEYEVIDSFKRRQLMTLIGNSQTVVFQIDVNADYVSRANETAMRGFKSLSRDLRLYVQDTLPSEMVNSRIFGDDIEIVALVLPDGFFTSEQLNIGMIVGVVLASGLIVGMGIFLIPLYLRAVMGGINIRDMYKNMRTVNDFFVLHSAAWTCGPQFDTAFKKLQKPIGAHVMARIGAAHQSIQYKFSV